MSHQAPDFVEINVELAGPADFPDNPEVGTVYEVAINGEGYMLADDPERQISYQRGSIDLQPQRLATSDTPFDQAVERYSFATDEDWTAGAGQFWRDREGASTSRFFDSDGVDPFSEEGVLSLLNATERTLQVSYDNPLAVVVGEDLYVLTGDDELTRHDGTEWKTPVTVTDGGAVTILDMASDGQFWYGATGSSIVRGTTTDPAAAWSTEPALQVRWAAGRICAAVKASGSTPNRFTTLAPDGSEELTDGHLTLEEGHTVVLGGAAQGVFWFGSYVGDQGLIWAWQLGLDSEGNFHTPFVAWELPQGLIPTSVATAAGEVWVRAYAPTGPDAGNVRIYRGVPSSGLVPILVADLGQGVPTGSFDEHGDNVLFSWRSSTGKAALGAVNLISGGYARWLRTDVEGPVTSIVTWKGLDVFTVGGQGVYALDPDSYETEGWLRTSIADGSSALDKVWDQVEVLTVGQLNAGESVSVEGTTNEGGSFFEIGELAGAGARRVRLPVQRRSATMGLRYTLKSTGTTQTKITLVSRRYYPLGLSDVVVVLPIDCGDNLRGLNGHELPGNAAGSGARRARDLESLTQTRVKLQDIDWAVTRQSHVYVVVNSQVTAVGVYDKHLGRKVWRQIVTLTLRRPLLS